MYDPVCCYMLTSAVMLFLLVHQCATGDATIAMLTGCSVHIDGLTGSLVPCSITVSVLVSSTAASNAMVVHHVSSTWSALQYSSAVVL